MLWTLTGTFEQYKSMVEGAKGCGDLAETSGVTLIIEPLNTKVDHSLADNPGTGNMKSSAAAPSNPCNK